MIICARKFVIVSVGSINILALRRASELRDSTMLNNASYPIVLPGRCKCREFRLVMNPNLKLFVTQSAEGMSFPGHFEVGTFAPHGRGGRLSIAIPMLQQSSWN